MALWKTYNPDPALIKGSQWGHWHPSHTQQPQQLKSLVADGGWMAAPGAMLSGSLRRFSTRAEVETKNSFSALQTESEPLADSTVPELPQLEPTKISPRRSPGSTPSGGSPPGCSGPPEPSRRPVGRTPATRLGERRPVVEQLCGRFQRKAGCVQKCCEAFKELGTVRKAQLERETMGSCWAFQNPNQLRIFTERRPQSLMPLCSTEEWEYVEFILDSGATATVIPPNVGKAYTIQPGDASRAGVTGNPQLGREADAGCHS